MDNDIPVDTHVEDGALLSQIAGGASAALEELSRRYSRNIKATAFGILFDEGDTEEVLQDVLWKVWRRAPRYDPGRGSVAAWIFIITRRCAIDRLRTRKALLRAISQQPWRESLTLPEVQERELFRSRLLRVRKAFGELPVEQRHVLALAFFRGLSQREIARATGIPLGTIKTRTNTAKKKLQKSLGLEDGIESSAAA
jgi:RNA polymerase sigma-70 factor (ECF subfamily)